MPRLVLLGALAALLAAMTAVQAYPNLNATTGILAVPTAAVVAPGALVGAADVLFFSDTTLNARAIYGLSPAFEVGAGIVAGTDTAFGINGKYLLPITPLGFDWAIGATFQTGSGDVGDGTQIYFTGTKPFGMPGVTGANLLGTIGISFTDIDSASEFRPFVGAQLALATNTEVAAEFVFESGDFDESIFSLLVRQHLSDGWTGEIGITNAVGFTGNADSDFFIGAAYAFATP